MNAIILIPAFILFFLEWYVIRWTGIKSYIPILVTGLIGLPIGLFYGLHLVAYPLLFVILAWVLCLVEDEWKKFFKRKGMTEDERSRLKDL